MGFGFFMTTVALGYPAFFNAASAFFALNFIGTTLHDAVFVWNVTLTEATPGSRASVFLTTSQQPTRHKIPGTRMSTVGTALLFGAVGSFAPTTVETINMAPTVES